MRSRHESPLPAAFQVEVIERGVSEVDGKSTWLESGENRITVAVQGLQAHAPAVRRPLLDQTRCLGKMTVCHKSPSSKSGTHTIVRDPRGVRRRGSETCSAPRSGTRTVPTQSVGTRSFPSRVRIRPRMCASQGGRVGSGEDAGSRDHAGRSIPPLHAMELARARCCMRCWHLRSTWRAMRRQDCGTEMSRGTPSACAKCGSAATGSFPRSTASRATISLCSSTG